MNTARATSIGLLADEVVKRSRRNPQGVLRVAVTGITASGKSTLAAELTGYLQARGIACFQVHVDGFHNARAIRHRRGRDSAEGYYRDAYDYPLLLERALHPLGPGGDRRYVARAFDVETDAKVDSPLLQAPPGSVGIFDASFLLRPEIRDAFDYRIFVQTSFERAEQRGVRRDAAALGGEEQARRLFRTRYHAAQRIYFQEAQPLQHSDVLFINDDLDHPLVFLRAHSQEAS